MCVIYRPKVQFREKMNSFSRKTVRRGRLLCSSFGPRDIRVSQRNLIKTKDRKENQESKISNSILMMMSHTGNTTKIPWENCSLDKYSKYNRKIQNTQTQKPLHFLFINKDNLRNREPTTQICFQKI